MRVVVTGGSGRLGRSVVRELVEHGHTVLNADQLPTNDNPADRFMPVDLLELGQVYGAMQAIAAEAVVHLAAHPWPRFLPEEVTFRNNTLATFNVFQAALNCGVRGGVGGGTRTPAGAGGR